ncbi:MAG: TPM domain-containing protein, partial [Novosphingobium sp.]|nr:TPM domain-containing protein [Novosphingobium sp.]
MTGGKPLLPEWLNPAAGKREGSSRAGPGWPVFAAITALLLVLAGFVAPVEAAPAFPKLTGRVNDAANIIPADVETRLDQKLAALETQSRRQLVIVTLPDLQGYDIADYGYQLGRAWGIGSKARNDGALLIVAPKERKLRIEVGYGLEGVLTDGMSSLIINQDIVPRFKAGDMAGGIEAGTDAIIRQLTLPPEEARKLAAQADKAPEGGGG